MRILSIDVGIINLAIARIDFGTDETFTILNWELLDTRVEKIIKHPCAGFNKNGSACRSTGHWILSEVGSNNIQYWCGRHLKEQSVEHKVLVKDNDYMQRVQAKLRQTLDQHPEYLQADVVLIENQPSKTNPVMKTIQVMLHDYFCTHGAQANMSPILHVQPVHASIKMRACKDTECDRKLKSKYSQKKRRAVLKCRELLTIDVKHKPWLEHFDACKKKDDLSDCFLQAWAYVNRRK